MLARSFTRWRQCPCLSEGNEPIVRAAGSWAGAHAKRHEPSSSSDNPQRYGPQRVDRTSRIGGSSKTRNNGADFSRPQYARRPMDSHDRSRSEPTDFRRRSPLSGGSSSQRRWGEKKSNTHGSGTSAVRPDLHEDFSKLDAPTQHAAVDADPFTIDNAIAGSEAQNDADAERGGRSSRKRARKLDSEKRLRRAAKEKPQVVISAAALAKKAKKAAEAASGAAKASGSPANVTTKQLAVPSVATIAQLSQLLGRRLGSLQTLMQKMGHSDVRADRILTSDDSALVTLECGFEPLIDDALAFDIYPDPPSAADSTALEPRPPIVCVMGHVDHGKTTLLDALRSSSVAAGEAGGITQHIGAFEVSLADIAKSSGAQIPEGDGPRTVTFLDTPGHAAFAGMRSRGANLTDVVVLVVAADDGVKSQTKEVISLLQSVDAGVVVAITKCDKPGVEVYRAKAALLEAGIHVESLGGDVPCVEVSALTKKGLPELVETVIAVSEVQDQKAEREGTRFQARIIESNMTKEYGPVATLLCQRGTLRTGAVIAAGETYARVRQLLSPSGSAYDVVLPGQPARVIGWKEVPEAGSEALAADSEADAKRAVENRLRRQSNLDAVAEIEAINQKRSKAKEDHILQRSEMQDMTNRERKAHTWMKDHQARAEQDRISDLTRELRIIVKADTAGTLQAVTGALSPLGNDQVRVNVVGEGVGPVSESDVTTAVASQALVIGFNVGIDRPAMGAVGQYGIEYVTDTVIYRLIDATQAKLVALLPARFQERIAGEATILQTFEINAKTRNARKVAGCRVTNGQIQKGCKVRISRQADILWEGPLEQLKHGKKDVGSMVKGSECGMAFQGYQDFVIGDKIVSIELTQVERTLTDGL